MRQGTINPEAQAVNIKMGDKLDEVWSNDIYECQVRYLEPERGRAGALHLSIKNFDRSVCVTDWRHKQSIKNEVAGWEREAVEIYPRESRLVDGSNQFHLWVMPAGVDIPIGFNEYAVGTQTEAKAALAKLGIPDNGKGRQRDWQPGLSTGPEFARKLKARR